MIAKADHRAVLMDFGIARAAETGSERHPNWFSYRHAPLHEPGASKGQGSGRPVRFVQPGCGVLPYC